MNNISTEELRAFGFTGFGKPKVKYKDVKDDMSRKEFKVLKKERRQDEKTQINPMAPKKSDAEAQHPFTIKKGTDLFDKVVDKGKQIVTDTINKQSEQLKEIQMADETAAATTDKPWYKNPWYIGGGIAGFLGIAGAIIAIRSRSRKRRTTIKK